MTKKTLKRRLARHRNKLNVKPLIEQCELLIQQFCVEINKLKPAIIIEWLEIHLKQKFDPKSANMQLLEAAVKLLKTNKEDLIIYHEEIEEYKKSVIRSEFLKATLRRRADEEIYWLLNFNGMTPGQARGWIKKNIGANSPNPKKMTIQQLEELIKLISSKRNKLINKIKTLKSLN